MAAALVTLAVANLALAIGLLLLKPPGRVEIAVETRPTLPAQVAQLVMDVNAGKHGEPFTLVLTDADLGASISYYLANSPDAKFTHISVAVSPEEVTLDAVTKGLAVSIPVRVTVGLALRDGKPFATVRDVSLGSTQLPSFVRDQIIQSANKSLDLSATPLAVTLETLTLHQGNMTITGKVQ
jgi:uncharacterized protein YpmS